MWTADSVKAAATLLHGGMAALLTHTEREKILHAGPMLRARTKVLNANLPRTPPEYWELRAQQIADILNAREQT